MAAPAALSAAWFPADQRTTATAVSQMANGLGNGVSFLLGPKMVPGLATNSFFTDNFFHCFGWRVINDPSSGRIWYSFVSPSKLIGL